MSNGPVFNVRIDISRLPGITERALSMAQFALDTQIIKDSNYFAPEDIGTLKNSALLASVIGEGHVAWNTPYARRLYYNPQYNFSTDKNPNAQGLWFEAAKAMHKSEWTELVNRIVRNNI